MQYFTFHLPVKTYLKKYITSLYGDPFIASLNTDIGFVILNTLASRLEAKASRGYLDLWQNRYDATISFKIPFHYWSVTKKKLSPLTFVLLNRFFENSFQEELYKFIQEKRKERVKYKKAIEQFAEIYGIVIDTDISFDALQKCEYRHRKKNLDKYSRRLSTLPNVA